MGALLFAGMLGLVNYVNCQPKQILDIVPVDYVSNLILCTTAYTATCEPGTLQIAHSSSSQHHPITIDKIMDVLLKYSYTQPSTKQVFSPKVRAVENKFAYDSLFYLK